MDGSTTKTLVRAPQSLRPKHLCCGTASCGHAAGPSRTHMVTFSVHSSLTGVTQPDARLSIPAFPHASLNSLLPLWVGMRVLEYAVHVYRALPPVHMYANICLRLSAAYTRQAATSSGASLRTTRSLPVTQTLPTVPSQGPATALIAGPPGVALSHLLTCPPLHACP